MSPRQRWAVIALFATAMGYAEAAVVYYLRTMVNRIQPYQPEPLPDIPALAGAEIAREAATMFMLLTAGILAGRTWRGRIGFALLAFGIWDCAYYAFLIPLTGWPKGLLDWDILFLIPLPWWGPIAAPISIAALMTAFGILATVLELGEPPIWPGNICRTICCAGILLALYVFMADAIAALPKGEAAIRNVLPQRFAWPLFCAAWMMMFAPIAEMSWQIVRRYR